MSSNPLHSADSPEWYTPSDIVERARRVMGVIDLDPMSHAEANRTVRATKYYTARQNGLTKDWVGRVFINPAGGLVNLAWEHLYDTAPVEWVWIGYSLEQFQTLQRVGVFHPLEYSICIPDNRIAFVENRAKQAERKAKREAAGKRFTAKSTPTHANYICYNGPNKDRFDEEFRDLGIVILR